MKKVIDGKLYNTDTAVLIHNWDNGYRSSDFQSCEETLYRTKKGAYFIYGEGGPMSAYSESHGNSTYGGEDIRALTEQEARQWLEEHGGEDALEAMGTEEA